MQNLIDRLSVQSEAFQESYTILSRSKTLEEMAEKFFHVLRGNLLVVNASIFIKSQKQDAWRTLFAKSALSTEISTDVFNRVSGYCIADVDDPNYPLCIKHALIDKASIGILLGAKLDKSSYSAFDKIVLQFFLQQLDSAYQFYMSRKKEKQLIFNLNHRVLQLNSLIDTGIEVARLQEINALSKLALERVLALTNASKGMLRVKKGRRVIEKICYPSAFKSKHLMDGPYQIEASFEFLNLIYTFYLFEKESRNGHVKFDPTDHLLLDAFARQVHASLENHFLHLQALEKERIDKEISLAGSIQKKLIPDELPEIQGYELCGSYTPTRFIGGDFYDCIPLKDGRFALIMADVSGKGVAAGLLVSTLHASVHAHLQNGTIDLPALVQTLNEVIFDAATIEKYITAFFALLDPQSGELESVSAGHNPIYILRKNKKVDELLTGGIPLGMMRMSFPYESLKTTLEPGDSILLYTDGVTEAMNENEEEFDDIYPLKDFLISQHGADAKRCIDNLVANLKQFTGDTPQSDDITALYITRN